MLQRLTDALDFQAQALVLRSQRQRLIAGNIANADTPGYQARDMDFAQALQQATGGLPRPAQMQATQAGHIQPAAGADAEHHLLYATAAQTSVDNNTVDMDRERATFVDNAVKYEATLRFINGSVRSMMDAMKSHTQG